ncbi:MAG: thymidine kinase [Elusimicrobia bacterium]|nr:thymidine kinase [Elusimicrobiota bacterium]
MRQGHLEVIAGSMFSGKTTELIRRLRLCLIAKKQVQVFKSHLDARYKDKCLVSHDGFELDSELVSQGREILERVRASTQVVGIDEAQFFDESLIPACEELAERGIRVIAAGLDLDYRGMPFETMMKLLAQAELVTKNLAICSVCGDEAHYSQRLDAGQTGRIAVGAGKSYEARCRGCFEEPRRAISRKIFEATLSPAPTRQARRHPLPQNLTPAVHGIRDLTRE